MRRKQPGAGRGFESCDIGLGSDQLAPQPEAEKACNFGFALVRINAL